VRSTCNLVGVTFVFAAFSCTGLLVPTYGFGSCLGAILGVVGSLILLCCNKQPCAKRYRVCGIMCLIAAAFHLSALGIYVAVLASDEYVYRVYSTIAPVAQFFAISFEVTLATACYQTYWAIISGPTWIAPSAAQPCVAGPAFGVALPIVPAEHVVHVQCSEVQPPSTAYGESGRVWASSPGQLTIGVPIPNVEETSCCIAGRG
jgi:hypothetical protein